MSNKKKPVLGHSPEKQAQYEQEAQNLWGDSVKQTARLWNSYSADQQAHILAEAGEIYAEIVAKMALGPANPEVQALLVRWHQNLRSFYEPSLEVLRGLGQTYHDHPEFNATFTAMHPDLPAFLKEAIGLYVDELETQWLERELGILRE